MDYRQMTAPCGLDCFNCPVYLAGEDEALRTAISKKLGIPAEQVACQGCRQQAGIIPILGNSQSWRVYPCAQVKGLAFCHESL